MILRVMIFLSARPTGGQLARNISAGLVPDGRHYVDLDAMLSFDLCCVPVTSPGRSINPGCIQSMSSTSSVCLWKFVKTYEQMADQAPKVPPGHAQPTFVYAARNSKGNPIC